MNEQQSKDLLRLVQPGDIIYLNGGDWTSDLVKFGQGRLDKSWTSELSHVVFVDKDMNISESTIELHTEKIKKFPFIKLNLISGVKITPIAEWAKDDKIHWPWLIIQRFEGLTNSIITTATNRGLQMKAQGYFYPVRELVGSLICYLNYGFVGLFSKINPEIVAKWQSQILTRLNPLDSTKAEYCIAYVNDCFKTAGFPVIPDDIEESVSNLGCGMRRKDRAYELFFVSHLGVRPYFKSIGEEFKPSCIKDYIPSSPEHN